MIIKHPLHPKGGYYMEQALYDNLRVLPNRVKKDKDVLGVFVGPPGLGKSTMAQQCLYLLDPTMDVNCIKYSYEDYVKYCLGLFDKGKSLGKGVIHDEGKEALSAVSVMSKRTRNFMNFLYENRQMNMYQWVLTGDFFDLPKSIVMQRVLFMIFVHEEGEFDNGSFKFYNQSAMKRLYLMGKKTRSMKAAPYSLRGKFPKFYTVDDEEYRKLKKAHLVKERYLDKADNINMTKTLCVRFILQHNPDVSPPIVCEALKMDSSQFFQVRKKVRAESV